MKYQTMKTFLRKCLIVIAALAGAGMARAATQFDYYQAGTKMYVCSSTTTLPLVSAVGPSVVAPLALYNPSTSTIKVVLLETSATFLASPAAASALFLAYNTVPSTGPAGTAGTLSSAYVGKQVGTNSDATAKCFVSATLPAVPTAFRWIGGTTGAAAISGLPIVDKPIFDVVLPPGGTVSLEATSASSLAASFFWIEVNQ